MQALSPFRFVKEEKTLPEEEYKPNSHRSKELAKRESEEPVREKRVTKAISGTAKTREKSGISKLADIFLPGDVSSVRDYIWSDVVVPTIRRTISDIVCNGINMLLGEPNRKSNIPAAKVSYRQYYQPADERPAYNRPRAQASYSYNDIVFETRGDAEEALYKMEETLDHYDVVTVADLFDLAGLSCSYTDQKYGWTSLRTASVRRTRDGYMIELPRATSL